MANYVSKHTGAQIDAAVDAVLAGNGGTGGSVELDTTLTKPGMAADAKAVGDGLVALSEENERFSEEFSKVVIVNESLVDPDMVESGLLAQKAVGGKMTIIVSTADGIGQWYDTTGAIPIEAGQTVTGYPWVARFAAFDKNMEYISGSYLSAKTDTPYTYTATVDGFVRFCFSTTVESYSVYYGSNDKPMTEPGTFVNGLRLYKGSVPDDALRDAYTKKAFYGKTLMNFGDSIAAGDGNSGKSYADMIADANKMTLHDYAAGGATITTLKTDNTVQAQIDEAITEHAGESIDYILLEGGTNDVGSQAVGALVDGYDVTSCNTLEFVGAVETAIFKLRNAFPLAKIIFVSVHQMATRNYERQHQYHDALVPACKKWSVPIVDVFAEGGINSHIDSVVAACFNFLSGSTTDYDKTHPNAVGYRNFYVPMVEAAMNGH